MNYKAYKIKAKIIYKLFSYNPYLMEGATYLNTIGKPNCSLIFNILH